MRQLRRFVFRRYFKTRGLDCESTSTGGKLALIPYAGFPSSCMYSTCAGWNLKTWNLSLGGRRGTQGDAMQRSVHVHVTCAKRPTCRRRTEGSFVASYGAKFVRTCSRRGSTHFVSATIAIFAVISSPKRCTAGSTDAYALKGTPSPTDDPCWKIGRGAAAGAVRTRAAAATSATRFTRSLRATSDGDPPSGGTRRASRRNRGCVRRPARRRASGSPA